jgi:hypothetical protein
MSSPDVELPEEEELGMGIGSDLVVALDICGECTGNR